MRTAASPGGQRADLVYVLAHMLYLTGISDKLDRSVAGAPEEIGATFAAFVVRVLQESPGQKATVQLLERTLPKSEQFHGAVSLKRRAEQHARHSKACRRS